MSLRVGFIGLGAMGKGMAHCLARAGFPLTVYDIRPEPLRELATIGAAVVPSAHAVAAASDVLVFMVLNHLQVEEALGGESGALRGLGPGKTVVVMSTVGPHQARHLASLVEPTGAQYLDAPVSGGHERAAAGTLTIMVGGPASVLEAARPVLQAMGSKIFHIGPAVGSGQMLKAINNMLLSIAEVAAAEAMVLGVKAGIDPQLLYDVICTSSGDSWAFRHRMDRLLARDFSTKGALEILVKDLGIVLAAAQELHMPLLLAPVAYQVYQMGMVAGLGREDDAAVAKVIEGLAGVEVRRAPEEGNE